MKNIFKITFLFSLASFFVACESTELELLNSPNSVSVESADPNFIISDIQLTFNNILNGYSGASTGLMRMRNQFGTYSGAVDESTLNGSNGEWALSYQMFANIDLLTDLNDLLEESDKIPYHLGVAQVLEAYAYMLLVDYLGNVPFSEANNPEEFPNPNVDPGATVYQAQLDLLDTAIANLTATSNRVPADLYFVDFDASKWVALANTLKIRAYTNLRLTDPTVAREGINSVLASGNFINNDDKDFQFSYSNVQNPVESRHPLFTGNYLAAGAGAYMSNNLYDLMNVGDNQAPFIETGIIDPRARYYFYRQDANPPSGSNLPCAGDGSYDYCYVGNRYWGRDHADEAGIPNDNTRRTTYGVYPAGGAFDRDLFEQARAASQTMGGAGIFPIYLSSFTFFNLAEAELTLDINGSSAVAYLEQGIRQSMEKVLDFPTISTTNPNDNVNYAATQADVDSYVTRVLNEYNSGSASDKLNIIAREFLIAAFGNGIETYNLYRRTGFPTLQSPIISAGPFPRVFRYPADEISGNPNIIQQPLTNQVFWDNNPSNFID